MNTIGNIIGTALKGYTTIQREEIASQLGITRRTLDTVVKGGSNLTLEQIGKLSDILKINLLKQYLVKTGRADSSIVEEPTTGGYTEPKNVMSLNFTLQGKIENFGNFQNFLNDLRKLSDKYGYDVL